MIVLLIFVLFTKENVEMMFCNLNFCMKYLTLVSSARSTGIIVDTIRPLSMGIIVDLYIPWW